MTINLGLVPIVRPLFRGARMGLLERSERALAALGPRLGFQVAYAAPPVTTPDEAEVAAAEAGERARAGSLDFLLVLHVTFATGDLIAPILEQSLPAGIWALPEATASGPLPQNALCGLNLSLSLPASRAMPVKWFYGWAEDAAFESRLALTVRALCGWKAVRRGRVLWVGGTAPGFYRLESVPDLPVEIERVALDALFAALDEVRDDDVRERLASVDEPASFPTDNLRPTVRLEIALERLARGYSGVALRCWPEVPDQAGTMACAAFARLADRGVPLACEGDAGGLISMLVTAAVSGHPAALLDLSHLEESALLFWHCGNAPRTWASGQPRLALHFNRGLPAVRDMRLAPGPACGVRLLEDRKAAVYAGAVLPREEGYDGVSGWIGHLRWGGEPVSARGFLSSVLNHRLPHHFAWARGDAEAALIEACGWLGHEVLRPAPEATALQWPA